MFIRRARLFEDALQAFAYFLYGLRRRLHLIFRACPGIFLAVVRLLVGDFRFLAGSHLEFYVVLAAPYATGVIAFTCRRAANSVFIPHVGVVFKNADA